MKRNPESPWNPKKPCSVTPKEFEKQVVSWLKLVSNNLNSFSVKHLKHLSGSGGDYEFDGVAEFSIFTGATIIVLIECKRYSHPVEREKILSLYAKLQDVGAHKAMIFSTSGFQLGALSYAKDRGIACLAFVDGDFLYETKDVKGDHKPPPWANIPRYAAILMEKENESISCSTVSSNRIDSLRDWLKIRER